MSLFLAPMGAICFKHNLLRRDRFLDGASGSWFRRPQKFWIMAALESAKPCWKRCKRAPEQSPPSQDGWRFLVLLAGLEEGYLVRVIPSGGACVFFALVPFSNGIAWRGRVVAVPLGVVCRPCHQCPSRMFSRLFFSTFFSSRTLSGFRLRVTFFLPCLLR